MRSATLRVIGGLCLALAAAPLAAADDDGLDPEQVRQLSNGYAVLSETATKLNRLPKVLYVKFESDTLDDLATRLDEHASEFLAAAEDYAGSHPGIDLSETGLPAIDKARRTRTRNALLKDLATHSGAEFERVFLLAMLNLLNQLRHSAGALAEMPQDQAGKELAGAWHETFQSDYDAVLALLDREHFCDREQG